MYNGYIIYFMVVNNIIIYCFKKEVLFVAINNKLEVCEFS